MAGIRKDNFIADKGRIIARAALFIVAILVLYLGNSFLLWKGVVGHNQAGVGLNGLALYVLQYADDHNGVLPPMIDRAAFQSAVMPYAKSDSAFYASNDTQHRFLPNPNLSLLKVSGVKKLTVLLYESAPSRADGTRWVAFLPQNAVPTPFGDPDFAGLKQVKEADWQRLKVANRIL